MRDGFGELLRRYRATAGLSQAELAVRSGLGLRTISDIERGRTARPHRSSVDLLSRALGLSELVGRAGFLPEPGPDGMPAPEPPDQSGSLSRSAPQFQVVPRQLPAGTRHFVGRAHELGMLDGVLSRVSGADGTAAVWTISGTVGVGKSALAVHWARRTASDFPDGQLYIDLRGFDSSGTPLTPAWVIRSFLDAFQVTEDRIPASLDAQAGLYRSLLVGKRMLILLDNARDAAQVRPLLPGSLGCCAIVTSRSQLTSLVAAQDARPLILDVLADAEAREMLCRRLGPERCAAEPHMVSKLVGLCSRLPIALAIVAARAAVEPGRPLAQMAEEFRDARGRLDALDTGDTTTSLRAMFSWSYQDLSALAASMFRSLAACSGLDITGPTAARLAGVRLDHAQRGLRELTRASMLAEQGPGRFTFHDLLRAYAAEQATSADEPRTYKG
jgi:transcriptional regulator with XRE-family HTH domain